MEPVEIDNDGSGCFIVYVLYSYLTYPFWYWAASNLSDSPLFKGAGNAVVTWVFAPVFSIIMMIVTILKCMERFIEWLL
jgi:hypothetical protein